MVKIYWLLFLFLGLQSVKAQWSISNQLTLGGSDEDKGFAMDTLANGGGFFLAGSCESTDGDALLKHQYNDAWIIKLTPQREIEWQVKIGGFDLDEARSVKALSDGGCIAAGWTESEDSIMSENHGSRDAWIARLSADGSLLWIKLLGGSGSEAFHAVIQAPDGNFIALGLTDSQDGDVTFNHGGWDFWMVKVDTAGEMMWQKTFGGSNLDAGYDLINTADGGLLLTGQARSNDGDASGYQGEWDAWLIKTDAYGNIQWQKMMGGTGSDGAYKVIADANNEYYIASWTASANGDVTGNHGGMDAWLVHTDTQGNIKWQKNFGGSNYDLIYSLSLTANGKLVGAGFSRSNDGNLNANAGWDDAWVALWDTSGTLLWNRTIAGSLYDQIYAVIAGPGESFTTLGWTSSSDGDIPGTKGFEDVWLLSFDKNTGIQTPDLSTPLFSCSPNPGNSGFLIQTSVSASFSLTDLNGKVHLHSPPNTLQWNADTRALAPGVYFIQNTQNECVMKWVKY